MLAPKTLAMPRGMWGEPYRMGVNGVHNTVGGNVGAYNTAWVLSYVVIGGGLALNDTGFILVQATCPTSSLSRSVTLFLSLGARSLQWGYKREGERWGVQEVRSDSGQRGRE